MKKCILIFDDDPEILMVSKIILEQENYRVETRVTCDDVINDITKVKPSIILMDLRIPKIGGEKATQMLKKKRETRHIPVIIFSANTEIQKACERAHANGFLRKPFDVDTLLNVVKTNIA